MQVTTPKLLKILVLSILLLAVGSFSGAQAETYTVELGNYGPRPTVEVYFGDEGPYTFILDSGAPGLVIDIGVAESLSLEITGSDTIGAPGAQDAPTTPLYATQKITVGALQLEVAQVQGLDLVSFLPGENPPVGIIGFWEFNHGLTTLDLEKGVMVVDTEKGLDSEGAGVVPVRWEAGLPFPGFDIMVGGYPVFAHIDTGSPGNLLLPIEMLEKLEFSDEPAIEGQIGFVGGARDLWGATLVGSIEIAGYQEENPHVTFAERIPGANVGTMILRQTTVESDVKNGLLRIVPKNQD